MKRNHVSLLLFLLLILVTFCLTSILFGSVKISLEEFIDILRGNQTNNFVILMNIRLPRVALSLLSGMNLAVSGLLLQTVLKNPLADPGILGISSGAALGATVILILFPVWTALVPIVAFLGGMLAFFSILLFSWERELSPIRLVLSGVAVNAVIGGFQSVLMTMFSDRLHGVITWLNGDLSGKTWNQVLLVLGYSLPVYLLIVILLPKINVLNLSDSTVYSLGLSVRTYRVLTAILGIFLAGITVSQVGLIGFVGLIVPHLVRLLVGGNLYKLFPYTLLIGAIIAVFADFIARMIISPMEIPIGTVMSIVGGPFFLYLLSVQKKGRAV